MKKFIYLERGSLAPLMVYAKSRPSETSRDGVWIIKEYYGGYSTAKWHTPVYGQITWPVLKNLIFVGEVKTITQPK